MNEPAHHQRGDGDDRSLRARWPMLAGLLVVLALIGVLDASAHVRSPLSPVVALPASLVGAPNAESTSWYCTGGTGNTTSAISPAPPTLIFTNTTGASVAGTVTVSSDTGGSVVLPVSVPPWREVTVDPGQAIDGDWLASSIALDHGGVAVSEVVSGPFGWSEAPCASVTSTHWYFAAGATTAGNTMYLSLFNPTATVSVVDLTFLTPSGVSAPAPFEGLIVPPGGMTVVGVAEYVQNQSTVSTVVTARSGRIVAAELLEHTVANSSGLSVLLGSVAPEPAWSIARSVNVTGGQGTLVIANPGARSESVTVSVRLASGPVTPFHRVLAPFSVWTIATSAVTRIPVNDDFAITVTARGGPGIVAARVERSSSGGAVPQWGAIAGESERDSGIPARRWVIPSPVTGSSTPVSGAAPFALALENPSGRLLTVHLDVVNPGGLRPLPHGAVARVAPHGFVVIEPAELANANLMPLVLNVSGPLVALEDATPAGQPGVVAMTGVPLAG